MKIKLVFHFIIIILCASLLMIINLYLIEQSNLPSYNSTHTITKQYVWYCLPHKPGDQPLPTEKAKFIKNYSVIYIGDPNEKKIYLTFDDPSKNTKIEAILDTLKKHDIKAAFFMVEGYIRKNPNIIRRMVEEGHVVCNHTAHHINVSKLMNYRDFKTELEGVENAYKEATGFELPKFFRPPQGLFSELTLKYASLMGYTTVFWSFCYRDWIQGNQPDAAGALQKIMNETHPGEVVMLHTQSSTNVKILDDLICKWKEMGYTFGSLDDLKISVNRSTNK